MLRAIVAKGLQMIKMPASNESFKVHEDFYALVCMPRIRGRIDCAYVQINKPSEDHSETLRNKNGKFAVNVHAVCGSQLQFHNVARWPGSAHDSNIF